MWEEWNEHFSKRLKYLNKEREGVRKREGSRYREHRDWIMMTEKLDAVFGEWIQWRDERGPETFELENGDLVGVF